MLLYANSKFTLASQMIYFGWTGKRLEWGKSKSFCVAFITHSIKPSFTKQHLCLQTVRILKFKCLIRRRQNPNISTWFTPLFHDNKQYLRVLLLLLNRSRPITPVASALGAVPGYKGHLSHSSIESSKHSVRGGLKALAILWKRAENTSLVASNIQLEQGMEWGSI